MAMIAWSGFSAILLTVVIMFSNGSRAYSSTSLVNSRLKPTSNTHTNMVLPMLSFEVKMSWSVVSKRIVMFL